MGALSVRYTDRLVMRFGARRLMFPGFGLIAAGLALFATIPAGGAYLTHILPVTLLIAAGAGLSFPAPRALALSRATPAAAVLAAGLVNTAARVAVPIGAPEVATPPRA